MNRAQLEHVIRAAADIADDDEIIIIGSQSILGAHPSAPAELLATLPDGWKERLVLVSNANTRHAKGWCLEPHDLLLAK
jgi:hypothetical protein